MVTLFWWTQPWRTVWASKGPPEETAFTHSPEDLSQLLRLSKSWGLAHQEVENVQPHTTHYHSIRAHTSPRGSVRASAVTVWINCRLSPVMCGNLNLTLLPNDGDRLITRGTSCVKFFHKTLRLFHCLSDFGVQKRNRMWPRVALGVVWRNTWFLASMSDRHTYGKTKLRLYSSLK